MNARKTTVAFTLLEIMLVLGVMALLASLVVVNATAIFSGFEDKPLPEILKKAVREARFDAARNKEAVFLSFDPDSGALVISDRKAHSLESFPTGYDGEDPSLEIKFFRLLPDFGVSFGGRLRENREETDHITFFPDRSSTPFEVFLKYEEEESLHRYDPFSDAELKEKD